MILNIILIINFWINSIIMNTNNTSNNTDNTSSNASNNTENPSINESNNQQKQIKEAYFAGGCFWGVEFMMNKITGVIDVESGYMGGTKENPTYEQVCSDTTGHAEVVKVTYDPEKCSYTDLCRMFFEIHDPTQEDGQGPDIGSQYRSEIFYVDEYQKNIAEKIISILKDKGYDVVTRVTKASTFWKAEDYHQKYYERKGTRPYCHAYTKRF